MNLSGILIMVAPEHIDKARATVGALENVEVYHVDRQRGRFVVVQEAESIGAKVDGLRRIKKFPHVLLAEMVHHYFAQDDQLFEFRLA
jgi:nitrate reductase NapAB chaperone NapD